jgi:hypothetical protein
MLVLLAVRPVYPPVDQLALDGGGEECADITGRAAPADVSRAHTSVD